MLDPCTITLPTAAIRTTDHDGVTVAAVTGEIDLTSGGPLLAVLVAQLDRHPATLMVDLTATEFLSAAGIAALVESARRAQDRGVAMVVAAGHPAVLRPLQLTGASEALDIRPAVAPTPPVAPQRRAPAA